MHERWRHHHRRHFAAQLPGLRAVLADAHIIQAPFAVAPYDDADGQPGILWTDDRIPRGLYRRRPPAGEAAYEAELANPPYPVTVICGTGEHECGIILATAQRAEAGAMQAELRAGYAEAFPRVEPAVTRAGEARWRVQVTLIALYDGYVHCASGRAWLASVAVSDPLFSRRNMLAVWDQPATSESWKRAVVRRVFAPALQMCALVAGSTSVDLDTLCATTPLERMRRLLDHQLNVAGWALSTALVVWTLLNARNIVEDAVEPRLDRAARRRGEPPPYRYHVLRVRPGDPSHPHGQTDPTLPSDPVALHWVRGHLKQYGVGGSRKLFGKYAGCYWWQPHLAGKDRSRFVDKAYAIEE